MPRLLSLLLVFGRFFTCLCREFSLFQCVFLPSVSLYLIRGWIVLVLDVGLCLYPVRVTKHCLHPIRRALCAALSSSQYGANRRGAVQTLPRTCLDVSFANLGRHWETSHISACLADRPVFTEIIFCYVNTV
jgi:hypothetical protein